MMPLPTLEDVHAVTAIVGDVASAATLLGMAVAGAASLCDRFGAFEAAGVLEKVASGCSVVGVDVKKVLSLFSLGGASAAKKASPK